MVRTQSRSKLPTITFQLLPAQHNEGEQDIAGGDKIKRILKLCKTDGIPGGRIPHAILAGLTPKHFGIYDGMPEREKIKICEENFGTPYLAQEYSGTEIGSNKEHIHDVLEDADESDTGEQNKERIVFEQSDTQLSEFEKDELDLEECEFLNSLESDIEELYSDRPLEDNFVFLANDSNYNKNTDYNAKSSAFENESACEDNSYFAELTQENVTTQNSAYIEEKKNVIQTSNEILDFPDEKVKKAVMEYFDDYQRNLNNQANEEETFIDSPIEEMEEEIWDCESILTTLTNTLNQPNIVPVPQQAKTRDQRATRQKGHLNKLRLDKDEEKDEEKDKEKANFMKCVNVARTKGETKEMKRARKSAIKAANHAIRETKKENVCTLKTEKKMVSRLKSAYDTREGVRVIRYV